jgi:hypothetical protein
MPNSNIHFSLYPFSTPNFTPQVIDALDLFEENRTFWSTEANEDRGRMRRNHLQLVGEFVQKHDLLDKPLDVFEFEELARRGRVMGYWAQYRDSIWSLEHLQTMVHKRDLGKSVF